MTFFYFLVICSIFTFQPLTSRSFSNLSFIIQSTFSQKIPLSHFQIYKYSCTIAILQLQIIFYNCRNCHQLHVKIYPAPSICRNAHA